MLGKCHEQLFVIVKKPLSYKTEKQDCKYTNIKGCTNYFEMSQTFNIKAVLQSVSVPQTLQYGGKDMIVQETAAADKSGTVGMGYYSQLVHKVNRIS